MDKIWLGEQERAYSCGPASLKYALCVLGFSPKEQQLRRLARTTWRGTQTTKLMSAARRFGLVPRLRVFVDDEFTAAWTWLVGELAAGRMVILDVEGFAHYVVAVQELDGNVVIIDPEGEAMDGSAYADVVVSSARSLKSWWLSGDEEGEPEAFRGISLELDASRTAPRPRLRFSAAALRRYRQGRHWLLDEYLLDVVEVAAAAAAVAKPPSSQGDTVALADVVRSLDALPVRVAFWHGASAAEVQMAKAHLEDLAVAAEAMALRVPLSDAARASVAADVAALLTAMLHAPE